MKWQPIETAPKDGTAILVLLFGSDIAHAARWYDEQATIEEKYQDGGPGWYLTWDHYKLSARYGPTNWMPLPPPPEEE